MIRVGFFLTPTRNWLGGINYFKNLFLAIAASKNSHIEIVLIVQSDIDAEILDMILPLEAKITVVRTRWLQSGHPLYLARRLCRKLLGSELLTRALVRRYRLDVISHSEFFHGTGAALINWLPDFQHVHLPSMFDSASLTSRQARYAAEARHADRIVVSSEDARHDLCTTLPWASPKISVLRFVSSAPSSYWTLDEKAQEQLIDKYQLEREFFYVPNQFWKHKNHTILLRALQLAKQRELKIQIVCSGSTSDPRSPDYFENFKRQAIEIGCGDTLRILGIVPYEDVFSLIKFSAAVVNPSKFEGWSSTVEECKSVGKRMLLSNIAVHREQLPEASFFDPDNAEELVDLLESTLSLGAQRSIGFSELKTINQRRCADYGAQYLKIVEQAISAKSKSELPSK